MAKFRNISGIDLYVVAVSRVVEDDGVFEIADEAAPGFECQPSNYKRIDEPKAKAAKESNA